jgi:hypothetical protein
MKGYMYPGRGGKGGKGGRGGGGPDSSTDCPPLDSCSNCVRCGGSSARRGRTILVRSRVTGGFFGGVASLRG